MKNISILYAIKLIFIFILFFISSCDDDYIASIDSENVDCEYCFEEKPDFVELALDFNLNEGFEKVDYIVYSGFAFNSEVYLKGIAEKKTVWIWVEPDKTYSVVAIYERYGQKIMVVNDSKVKTEYFRTGCDKPCYYVYEVHCDLKLKK